MSSAENDTRPVWLTREQRDVFALMLRTYGYGHLHDIVAAWDAAPADPAKVIAQAVFDGFTDSSTKYTARRVLAALGVPDANQETP